MWRNLILPILAVVALAVSSREVQAAVPHEGEVISAGGGRIVILDKNGDDEQFDVADDAQITVNGKLADLEDLKAGDSVKLTVKERKGKPVAVVIDGKSKQ